MQLLLGEAVREKEYWQSIQEWAARLGRREAQSGNKVSGVGVGAGSYMEDGKCEVL